jgi:hypothetical protein
VFFRFFVDEWNIDVTGASLALIGAPNGTPPWERLGWGGLTSYFPGILRIGRIGEHAWMPGTTCRTIATQTALKGLAKASSWGTPKMLYSSTCFREQKTFAN